MSKIIQFPGEEQAPIDLKDMPVNITRNTPEILECSGELDDYIKTLSLTVDRHNNLVSRVMLLVTAIERNAFLIAVDMTLELTEEKGKQQ